VRRDDGRVLGTGGYYSSLPHQLKQWSDEEYAVIREHMQHKKLQALVQQIVWKNLPVEDLERIVEIAKPYQRKEE
jgi:hypothetical protein